MSLEHLNMPEPPVKSVSYSKVKSHEKCPYKTFLSGVKKEKGPKRDENHPAERGERIHKEAENYVQGVIETLPASLKKFKDKFKELRELYDEGVIKVEDEWAFDQAWNVLDHWYGDDVWLRMKADAMQFFEKSGALIIDYKTGKSYGNEVPHTQQGQLYAIGAFMRYPDLEVVEVQFWYLDEGRVTKKMYKRDQIGRFLARFMERFNKLTTCVNFTPKPNIHNCKWCDFGPEKGTNVCPYGVNL